ncbi:MAG: hypothetical protein ACRDLD_01035 [Thermoleophilaceae bacterium]
MFDRFKRRSTDDRGEARGGVATAPREGTSVGEPDPAVRDRDVATRDPAERGAAPVRERRFDRGAERDEVRDVRARQREEFGGVNWGSAFFGWLVAVGIAAILLGLLSAAGAAFGLGDVSEAEAEQNAETIGIVGGILLIVVLAIAYYCGGYVSGRMSRFDGGRQGAAVWALGLIVTILLAVSGALFGAEYNVLEQLNLPRIPIEEGDLTAGAAVALALVLIGSLVAASIGGKAGERYHRKVDRFGVAPAASTRLGRVRAD